MQRLQHAPVTPARATEPAGLTGELARQRLAEGGANAIPDEAPHALRRAAAKLWAPVPWMLELAIALQLATGAYGEAAVVGALLLFNAGLGFIQEGRAQATLDALKSRLAPVATVRRDGVWTTMPAATLVQGDLVRLSLGSVVAADVTLAGGSLLIDQSMLTGESLPVQIGAGSAAYAGALVRRGEATAIVTATGRRTKFGRTAELVRGAGAESSAQKAIFRVVRNLVIFNGGVTVLLAAYAWHLHLALSAIVPLVLVAVLSSIPVALQSMFRLASAVGAGTLGRHGVLPTRLSAVDEAGGIDVLCADKTGTLTRNELAVISVATMPGQTSERVLALAALASLALFYVSRERRHLWSSRPGTWLIVSSAIDLSLFATLTTRGLLMAPPPLWIVAGLAAAAFLFAFMLDASKLFLFERFGVA